MTQQFSLGQFNSFTYFSIAAICLLLVISIVILFSHYFAKYFIITFIDKFFHIKNDGAGQIIFRNRLLHRISYLIPAFILYHFNYLFDFEYPHLKLYLSELIKEMTTVYIIIGIFLVISAALNCVNDYYQRLPIAIKRPIKSYLQVIKIVLFSLSVVFIVSILLNKSPIYIFSGVTAATALFALLFKDSLMGFVASIQLSAYDMIRLGDWIEMSAYGADGEVIDISLNTVKVQNFDKTIVTIPSYALLTSGLKNWRGMYESRARRVKHSISLDINSIKWCDEALLKQLRELHPHISFKEEEVLSSSSSFNSVTNIGLLRIYLEHYLHQHPGVHQQMAILIRQLPGTPTGLPIELYFFTNETASEKYESIISDIMEHVYAIVPQFELRVFQNPANLS